MDHFSIFYEFPKMNKINGITKEIWRENKYLNQFRNIHGHTMRRAKAIHGPDLNIKMHSFINLHQHAWSAGQTHTQAVKAIVTNQIDAHEPLSKHTWKPHH